MKLISILTLGLFAALLTGCQSGGAKLPKNTQKYNYEDSASFVLLDSGAQRSVTSSGIQETTLPDGRLQVVANMRNRENRRIQVQTQCVFKNENGFPYGDETAWRSVFLDENAQEGVIFTSMSDQARKYTIRVREAR